MRRWDRARKEKDEGQQQHDIRLPKLRDSDDDEPPQHRTRKAHSEF
jgi:hypothetical protein